jgi:hypothetical protein
MPPLRNLCVHCSCGRRPSHRQLFCMCQGVLGPSLYQHLRLRAGLMFPHYWCLHLQQGLLGTNVLPSVPGRRRVAVHRPRHVQLFRRRLHLLRKRNARILQRRTMRRVPPAVQLTKLRCALPARRRHARPVRAPGAVLQWDLLWAVPHGALGPKLRERVPGRRAHAVLCERHLQRGDRLVRVPQRLRRRCVPIQLPPRRLYGAAVQQPRALHGHRAVPLLHQRGRWILERRCVRPVRTSVRRADVQRVLQPHRWQGL